MTGEKIILLVDDQENIRLDLKQWLERKHYTVKTADSIEQAEKVIKSTRLHFAIVDLKLDYRSDYGGIEIVHKVKKHHPQSKTIILSAYSFSENIESKVKGKYDGFISKGGPENYITAVLNKLRQLDPVAPGGSASPKNAEIRVGTDTPGINRRHVLQGHSDLITRLSWSPDGQTLASASTDNTIRIWNVRSGSMTNTIDDHTNWIWCVAWSPDGCHLASGSEDRSVRIWSRNGHKTLKTIAGLDGPIYDISWSYDGRFLAAGCREGIIYIWETKNWTCYTPLFSGYGSVNSVVWAPDSFIIVSGGIDKKIRIWDGENGEFLHSFHGHDGHINSLDWSGDGNFLASGSDDRSIRIWDMRKRCQIWKIEGHTDTITRVSFSYDNRLLCSRSHGGTVRLWSCEKWVAVAKIEEPGGGERTIGWHAGSSFSPTGYLLAKLGACDTEIYILDLDIDRLLLHIAPVKGWSSYIAAKVVMVGESNVGKSCLSMRLFNDRYPKDNEQETTHGMLFWQSSTENFFPSAIPPQGQLRDIVLWDMGGQQEYRLVHQLFYHDMALAIVVIDPSRGHQALEEAREWNESLRKHFGRGKIAKLLVGAKQDLKSALTDTNAIEDLCRECEFEHYIETSAKFGRNIDELRKVIIESIDWDKLSNTSRPELFQRIRDAIEGKRKDGEILIFLNEFKAEIRRNYPEIYEDTAVKAVSDQLETHGMIAQTQRADGQDIVVLQLPVIERYAGSLIIAARNNPRGVPAIEERDLSPTMPALPELENRDRLEALQESIVVECIVELMIRHGICFRHERLLIFPSLFPKGKVDQSEEIRHSVSLYFHFAGAIDNIYASLVARLMISQEFGEGRLWAGHVEFEQPGKGVCGIRQVKRPRGLAYLDLFFSENTEKERRNLFTRFVDDHLRRQGVEVHEHVAIRCRKCTSEISEDIVHHNIMEGQADVMCPYCRSTTLISDDVHRIMERDLLSHEKIHVLRKKIDDRTTEDVQEVKKSIARSQKDVKEIPIRILHLSDLHFTENTSPKTKLRWLAQDICKGECLEHDSLEYIVITGDFTDKCNEAGFRKALEFISLLIAEFDVSAQRCIFTPGNHDVESKENVYLYHTSEEDAEKKEPDRNRWHREGNLILTPNELLYPQRFNRFSNNFFHPIVQKPYPSDYVEQGMAYLFPDTRIQFLALNSAWEIDQFHLKRSGLHPGAVANIINEADRQCKDAIKLGRIEEADDILRICVWHHAINHAGAIQRNIELVENLQKDGVRLCLHGDVHEMNRNKFRYWHQDAMDVIGAGSFGSPAQGRPESTPRLYNLIEIKRDFSAARIHTRHQKKPDGPWEGWYEWSALNGEGRVPYFDIDL